MQKITTLVTAARLRIWRAASISFLIDMRMSSTTESVPSRPGVFFCRLLSRVREKINGVNVAIETYGVRNFWLNRVPFC